MNILILTSVYPSSDDSNENVTKVVQYFAKSWVGKGHNVKVVHNIHRYPVIAHIIPTKIKKFIATKIGFYIPDYAAVKEKSFMDEQIKVWKLPIFKIKPHGGHRAATIKKQASKIVRLLNDDSFTPDVIVGHWMSPQVQIIAELKKVYNVRTALVLHGKGYVEDTRFNVKQYLSYVDVLGCRSKSESEYLQKTLNLEKSPFVCYSGVPDKFVKDYSFDVEKFIDKPNQLRFIYAGRLVSYKHIDKILYALAKFKEKDFLFDIIGEGTEEQTLKNITNKLGIENKVIFHGRLPRTQVLEHMKKAHCFVMTSKGEVFGLVYLEAMAASCVVIGSLGEGIDGVIKHKENGLLCEPANVESLENALNQVFEMNAEQLANISRNAYNTATKFTDSNVAEWYLDSIING